MGLLDDVLGSSVPQGDLKKPLMIALIALLASGALHRSGSGTTSPSPPDSTGGGLLGGLGGLLARFEQGGQGDVIKSWIGSGQNSPISPSQMGTALGPSIIKALAEKSGLSEQELTTQLSQVLPGVIDKLTPNGRLPTQQEATG